MDKNKRSRWLLFVVWVVFMLTARLMTAAARHATPDETRRLLIIGAMALFAIPFGFIYGRNSGRKDQLGKIARFSPFAMAVAVGVGSAAGGRLAVLDGLGGGFLAGYAAGWMVWKRIMQTQGDTAEADQVLNLLRSDRTSPASVTFLKTLSQPARRAVRTLQMIEVLMVCLSLGLGLWPAVVDSFDPLIRAMHTRSGDGTVFFITTDPMVIGVPLIMLSICAWGMISELLLPAIAGTHKDAWLEFKRLRDAKCGSSRIPKPIRNAIACTFIVVLVSVLLLFMDSYVKVTHDGIELNRFLGIGAKFYRWSDVRTVYARQQEYMDKNGRKCRRFYVKVAFTDGTAWTPDTSFGRREPQIEKAVRYVAQRKGL